MWSVAKQALGGALVLFILLGIIRPAVKSLMSRPLQASGAAGELELQGDVAIATAGANGVPALANQAQQAPLLASSDVSPDIDTVKQFVNQDAKISAQVIKGWVGE